MSGLWTKWIPAIAIPAVIAAAVVVVPLAANADTPLPDKSAAQLLTMIAHEKVTALSGTVQETSNLGLPEVPAIGSGSSSSSADSSLSSILSFATGTHSARIFVDGAKNVRLQVMDQLAERDIIRHGSDVWYYDSKKNAVTHGTIEAPKHAGHKPSAGTASPKEFAAKDPAAVAKQIVATLGKTSTLTVTKGDHVAGRSVYELILTPKATDTLVGSVSIAVDSATGLPLQVEAMARGQKSPAISLGFTQLTLGAPASSIFAFTPPKGAKVTEQKQPAKHATGAHPDGKRPTGTHAKPAKSDTMVIGSGWDAVLIVKATGEFAKLSASPQFSQLTTAVNGGRLFSTSLVNILFTSDGRVLVGSVSVDRLLEVPSAK